MLARLWVTCSFTDAWSAWPVTLCGFCPEILNNLSLNLEGFVSEVCWDSEAWARYLEALQSVLACPMLFLFKTDVE